MLKNPLFLGFSESEIKAIVGMGTVEIYESGAVILEPDEPKRYLMIVLKGRASVTKTSGEKRIFLKNLYTGDTFGVAALMGGEQYISTIIADTKSKILLFDEEIVRSLIHNMGKFAENYIRFLTSRIGYLNEKIESFTASSAESRLARYILSLPSDENGNVQLSISLIKLAEQLDIGRASLYRAINEFTEKKLILRVGKSFRVLNRLEMQNLK